MSQNNVENIIDLDGPRRMVRVLKPRGQGARFAAELESCREAYHAAVEALADRVRRELVIPTCRRRKMTFTSGMGDYFFSRSADHPRIRAPWGLGETIGSADEARATPGCKGLARIFAVLDVEVEYNHPLGFWVCDVTEEDLL